MMIGKFSNPFEVWHQHITWLVLFLLLLLRIPYTIAIIYLLPIENQMGAAIYEVGTYLLISFLIWWERDRLDQFHLDRAAFFLIVLLRPVQTLLLDYWKIASPLAFPKPLSWPVWCAAIGLLLLFLCGIVKLPPITAQSWHWLALGLIAGTTISIGGHWEIVLNALRTHNAFSISPLISTGLTLLYHIGFAPLNEEPLFRGFLWGALRGSNWPEVWIWIVQTILFTSAHIYFAAQYPLRFWILIPAAALLFGLLSWRSRSVAPAILAHGLINGSAYLFVTALIK